MQCRPFAFLALAALPFGTHAQVTLKPDGEWRSLFTAGASLSTGNTDAKSASLSAEVVRLRSFDKWSLDGAGQYATSDGAKTADRDNGTALYTRDITPVWFGFGQLDLLHDVLADISSRTTLGSGLGYHVFKEPDLSWDVQAGLAYTLDRYAQPQFVDDALRRRYDHADVLLSEESNHKFSDTTTFRQKLIVYPNLRGDNDVRTVFDTGLSVSMTKQLSLTASFEHRYDSHPGAGLGKTDTQWVTGLSLRFD